MSDINLLPDELRDKEEKELRAIRKQPKRINIDMSSPKRDITEQPLHRSRPSLMSRLFTKKTRPGVPVVRDAQSVAAKSFDEQSRAIEKRVNIPKMPRSNVPGIGASRIGEDSNVSLSGGQSNANDSDRPTSFITQDTANQETVKISARKEEVIENIAKSPRPRGSLLMRLFGSKNSRSPKKIDKSKDKMTEVQDLQPRDKEDGDNKQRDTVLDVNLIPEEFNRHPELEVGKKLATTGVYLGISVLLILVGYFGLTWYQFSVTQEAQKVQQSIVLVDEDIQTLEKNKLEAVEFQEYLKLVKSLLDKHVYWSQFFKLLEENTSREVFFSSFTMSGTDKLVINAQALDYDAVAEQIVAFEKATNFISAVRVDSAAASINKVSGLYEGVSFTVSLEFLPGVFLNPVD